MTDDIVKHQPTGLARTGTLRPEHEADLENLMAGSRAPSTQRAYRQHWDHWEAWCAANGYAAIPTTPEVLSFYLADRMKREKASYNTIKLALAAIGVAHKVSNLPNVKTWKVAEVLRGLRKKYPHRRAHKKHAITPDTLARMLAVLPPLTTMRGLRDRAILLLGFAGAFRRSELVALNVENLQWAEGGLGIMVTRSKTDQEAQGQWVRVGSDGSEFDPVVAVRRWLDKAEIHSGPVFPAIHRSGRVLPHAMGAEGVHRLVRKQLLAAGLDPKLYGAHSLRAGFVTECFQQGVGLDKIMAVTRHKSVAVAMGYNRPADPGVTGVGVTVRLGEKKP